jgi:hypothetical protein
MVFAILGIAIFHKVLLVFKEMKILDTVLMSKNKIDNT